MERFRTVYGWILIKVYQSRPSLISFRCSCNNFKKYKFIFNNWQTLNPENTISVMTINHQNKIVERRTETDYLASLTWILRKQLLTLSPTWAYLLLPSLLPEPTFSYPLSYLSLPSSSSDHISSPFPTFPQEILWLHFMY